MKFIGLLAVWTAASVLLEGSATIPPLPTLHTTAIHLCKGVCDFLVLVWNKTTMRLANLEGYQTEITPIPKTMVIPIDGYLENYSPQDVPDPLFSRDLPDIELTVNILRDFCFEDFVTPEEHDMYQGYNATNFNGNMVFFKFSPEGYLMVSGVPLERALIIKDKGFALYAMRGAMFRHANTTREYMVDIVRRQPTDDVWADYSYVDPDV